MRWFLASAALLILTAACTPPSIAELTEARTESAQVATPPPVTSVPTAHLVPSATATLPPTSTLTPTATLTPTFTLTPTDTPTRTPTQPPTSTPTATASRTLIPTNTVPPTATSTLPATATATRAATAVPPAEGAVTTLADHYYLARPLSDNAVNYAARTYPYGATSGGRLQVHLGQDLINPTGTPVLAAADGVVIHAGDDLMTQIGPTNNYYGIAVVIEHAFRDSTGEPVYTVYGHLNNTTVSVGQSVKRGDTIGHVGGTGVAMGPHLHFEVRVGSPFDYRATRNPDLWVFPYFGFGTLAGRVTDSAGNLLNDVTLSVVSDTVTRYTFSYADDTVNSDSAYGENWTLGDLPEGYYTVLVSENGRVRFSQEVFVFPAKTTWVDVVLQP